MKQTQLLISELKVQFSNLQQQINSLNGKVDEVKASAEQVKDERFYKDVEMDLESKSQIYDKIANCKKDINATSEDPGFDDSVEDDS